MSYCMRREGRRVGVIAAPTCLGAVLCCCLATSALQVTVALTPESPPLAQSSVTFSTEQLGPPRVRPRQAGQRLCGFPVSAPVDLPSDGVLAVHIHNYVDLDWKSGLEVHCVVITKLM